MVGVSNWSIWQMNCQFFYRIYIVHILSIWSSIHQGEPTMEMLQFGGEGDGESIKRAISCAEKLLTFLFSVYVWCKFFPFNSLTYLEVMISVKTLKSNAIKSDLLLTHMEINPFWCIFCYFLPMIKNCCISNCV